MLPQPLTAPIKCDAQRSPRSIRRRATCVPLSFCWVTPRWTVQCDILALNSKTPWKSRKLLKSNLNGPFNMDGPKRNSANSAHSALRHWHCGDSCLSLMCDQDIRTKRSKKLLSSQTIAGETNLQCSDFMKSNSLSSSMVMIIRSIGWVKMISCRALRITCPSHSFSQTIRISMSDQMETCESLDPKR